MTRRERSSPAGLTLRLAAQSELRDEGPIPVVVLADEIGQEPTSLPDELEESATRMMVLGKGPKMPVEVPDALREECDLDLGRSGVSLVDRVVRDHCLLRISRQRHSI